MKSAFDVYAISKALKEALEYITKQVFDESGLKPVGPMKWVPGNERQTQLMQKYVSACEDLKDLPELEAWAKKTAGELNLILAEHGFSIRLDPWEESPHYFGVVAIYDITIEWLVTGDVMNENQKPYWLRTCDKPAFRLSTEDAGLTIYNIDGQIVVRIPGKHEGDYLCITKADKPLEQFDLLGYTARLSSRLLQQNEIDNFDGAVLPNIVFDTEEGNPIDISWLKDLTTQDAAGDWWKIVQAKMQAKFAMGPKGARAKVAVAIGLKRALVSAPVLRLDYIVDHDVYLWMEREGLSEPFFAAYVPALEFADHIVDLSEAN